ncbi:MAG: VanZ family protein [Verrucomicrobiota bacterium]
MPRIRIWFKYWFPVVIWMALIYSASADRKSVAHSRLIGPLLRWLFPSISDDVVDLAVMGVRKAAHLAEYAVLGWLLWRALRKPVRRDPRPWSWRTAGWALGGVALYASSDEIHQIFVPGRTAAVHDVVIDVTGAAAGLLILWGLGCWRGAWGREAAQSRG